MMIDWSRDGRVPMLMAREINLHYNNLLLIPYWSVEYLSFNPREPGILVHSPVLVSPGRREN
jgi:hypothetical protein